MSRPAQLEQQMNRVKEIQEEMLKGEAPPEPVEETPQEPAAPPIVNESPATVSKEEFDKLEQRYRTLQGMHTADNQRHRAEIVSMQSAIQELENRLVMAEKATAPAEQTPSRYVTDEDEREYGETLEMVRRAAKEEAEAISISREQKYLERIANLERTLGYVQNTVVPTVEDLTRSKQDQVKAEFWAAINTQVPDWRTVNEDDAFKSWLLTEDPLTGATRQQFLSQAQREYNAPRVIKFFDEWKRSAAGGQTPALTPNAQNNPERFVAPSASKAGNRLQPEKKTWTPEDITSFYKEVQLGKVSADERVKIEKDIFLAQQDGRFKR